MINNKVDKVQNNRIAIRLMTPDNDVNKDRFYDCARRLKSTLESEVKFLSTAGDSLPRQVGQVASISDTDDVIWVRQVSNEDVLPCKSLIRLAAEQSRLGNALLVYVNPGPMMSVK